MSKLVIVESPSKAKTIQKYLGKGYEVTSSKGHIADLPKSQLGVDTESDYQPEYVVTKKATLDQLKKAMKGKDGLVLAVDPDREGEAIGWHVARELGFLTPKGNKKQNGKTLERIVFTEITEKAVKEAIQKPRELDSDLIDAQQARRVLDRLVGYKLSPLLWKKIRYGLSAGRVQSVAVRIIVDREAERDAFDPEEYWSVKAYLSEKKQAKLKIDVKIKEDGKDEEFEKKEKERLADFIEFELAKIDKKKFEASKQAEVDNILAKLESFEWLVTDITSRDSTRKPKPPFSTSAMQQAAANRLGFSASRTMKAAQKLYEAGHITYMRTDSISMSADAVKQVRTYITKNIGEKYLPDKPRVYKTKSKVAQEAHEAIRPTNFTKSAQSLKLSGEQAKLYKLITDRALASQMADAKLKTDKLIIENKGLTWQATGQRITFDGFLRIYTDRLNENILPDLKIGQELFANTVRGIQHFTQPPARYSEASLVKELESLGIGRPSTYAPIIHTILARKYVEKEGKYFVPTDTGKVVTALLTKHFPQIVDVNFTAKMEDDLDKVADGKEDWVEMMDDFYKPFEKNLKKKDKEIVRDDFTVLAKSKEKCPECGKKMVVKLGKFGRFLSCANFPDCKGMLPLDEDGNVDMLPDEKVKTKEFKDTYMEAPKTEDNRNYVLKKGRYGEFWAHPDYPKVKDAKPLELRPEKIVELYGEPPRTKDKRDFLLRNGKFGPFWAHPDYPEVKEIVSIKKQKNEKE